MNSKTTNSRRTLRLSREICVNGVRTPRSVIQEQTGVADLIYQVRDESGNPCVNANLRDIPDGSAFT